MLLSCLCIAYGCRDDGEDTPDSLYIHTSGATVDAAAGTRSITVYTTCAWQASGNDWISIDPASADAKGIYAVHLGFTANDTGSPRTGIVVFKAGNYTETYTLTQNAE